MKQKFGLAAIAAIVAVGTAVGYNSLKGKPAHSDLVLENIEALTYDEWGYDHGCVSNGSGCILRYNRWFPTDQPKDM